MTREDILRMALEAGFRKDVSGIYHSCGCAAADSDLTPPLERFAALVAAAQKEACAKVCDAERVYWKRHEGRRDGAESCAKAIRARGQA